MKKSQVLGLTIALAGNVALMMPETASAGINCTIATNANNFTSCSGTGEYTQAHIFFRSSKGVVINHLDTAAEFAACASHHKGSKSFGMSTSNTSMTIRSGTGIAAASGAGCANPSSS